MASQAILSIKERGDLNSPRLDLISRAEFEWLIKNLNRVTEGETYYLEEMEDQQARQEVIRKYSQTGDQKIENLLLGSSILPEKHQSSLYKDIKVRRVGRILAGVNPIYNFRPDDYRVWEFFAYLKLIEGPHQSLIPYLTPGTVSVDRESLRRARLIKQVDPNTRIVLRQLYEEYPQDNPELFSLEREIQDYLET